MAVLCLLGRGVHDGERRSVTTTGRTLCFKTASLPGVLADRIESPPGRMS
ncbi:MAG: hypothetical protein BMS9Abin37_0325 [Acidobacteriota bacterium]|nr:MAG: hypothetical protein BMS9Abin37_0325 [Acidobacteriota bacterium]